MGAVSLTRALARRIGRSRAIRHRGLSSRFLAPYLFLAPGYLLFLTWNLYPLAKAFQISLYRWSPIRGNASPFVGLENYAHALRHPVLWLSLRNTVMYILVTVPGQMVLGLLVALMLDRLKHGRVLFRAVYYLPVITSWVVVSLLFQYLFNSSPSGLVNYLLKDVLHILPNYVAWLSNPSTAWAAIWSLGIWKGIGWCMVILLAALQGIPPELYEVASLDGATGWRKTRYITLPLIRPTLVFVLVMLVIGGFNVFISVYLITGGGPMQRTEVLLSYMYSQAFRYLNFGYGAALSYLLAALIFAVSYIQMRLLNRRVEY